MAQLSVLGVLRAPSTQRSDRSYERQSIANVGKLQGLYIHGFRLTVGETAPKSLRRYRMTQVLQLNCDYSADGLESFRAASPNCIVHLRRQK